MYIHTHTYVYTLPNDIYIHTYIHIYIYIPKDFSNTTIVVNNGTRARDFINVENSGLISDIPVYRKNRGIMCVYIYIQICMYIYIYRGGY
jgi:hypothetical protein